MNNSEPIDGSPGKKAACWLALMLALLISPSAALAHAKLLRSQPKASSSSEQPPKLVELWFSEELEAGFNTIEVKDAQGKRYDRGEVTLAEGGKKAQVELQDLPPGSYTVEWRALSSDEHTLRGKFTFKVTAPAPGAAVVATPSPEQPSGAQQTEPPARAKAQEGPAPSESAGSEDTPITLTDSIVRWLGYLAMMTLFGGFATRLFVLGPVLREATGEQREADEGVAARRAVALFWLSLAVLIPTLLLALLFQSSAVHGVSLGEAVLPSRLGKVITRTGYGKSWLLQVLAAAALLAVTFLLGRSVRREPTGDQRGLWWAGLAASALLLLGPCLTGHTAAAAKDYGFATLADWLHLVAGGFWVGGLFHLALVLPRSLAQLGAGRRTRFLSRVIARFTRIAIPSVAVVALAGLYNSWIHLGSLGALWSTPYGKTLLVKLLLVLSMLALGGLNGFRFGPLAERLVGASDEAGQTRLECGFTRSLKFEAALGALVLLVAAILVFVTPERNHPTMTGETHPVRSAAWEGK